MSVLEAPPHVSAALAGEKADFVVRAAKRWPRKKAVGTIVVGVLLLAFMSLFVVGFLGPVIMGGESHFEANGQPVTASRENLGPLVMPALIIGLFVLIGFVILGSGVYGLMAAGAWFAGTPDRLVEVRGANVRKVDWEQFTGTIEVTSAKAGTVLTFELRTGRMHRGKHGHERWEADKVQIAYIPNGPEVERLCRLRIDQHDPTPAKA